ncbi:MAG: response regulator, partial [Cyanobacteria bacterium J06607_17]
MQKILLIGSSKVRPTTTVPMIEAAGYTVELAQTGIAGLEMARAQNPNLIICDWDLSDCDGHHILKQIRQDHQLVVTPFILLSSLYDHRHLRQTMQLGADDCLLQPFSDQMLLAAIATRLKQQEAVTNHYLSHLRLAAEHLHRLSYYDSLTKLPNHLLFEQRFTVKRCS